MSMCGDIARPLLDRNLHFARSEVFWRLTGHTRLLLFDVGARGGLPAVWRRLPYLMSTGFEPDAEECERRYYESGPYEYYSAIAPSDYDGLLPLNVTADPNCTSCYRRNLAVMRPFAEGDAMRIVETKSMKCRTIDSMIAQDHRSVDFLKIDVQGHALAVLRGAKLALERIMGVEVELEFSQMYEDQPLFRDSDNLLRAAGFDLFDLRLSRLHRRHYREYHSAGQVMWADAIYLRRSVRPAPVLAAKHIAIAEICGFSDFAADLTDHYTRADAITPVQRKQILALLRKDREPRLYYWLEKMWARMRGK